MMILRAVVALAIVGMIWFPICAEIYYDHKS